MFAIFAQDKIIVIMRANLRIYSDKRICIFYIY